MATKKKEQVVQSVSRYSKAQILNAKSIEYNKDVLQILLKDTEYYSLEELEMIVSDFLARKVD